VVPLLCACLVVLGVCVRLFSAVGLQHLLAVAGRVWTQAWAELMPSVLDSAAGVLGVWAADAARALEAAHALTGLLAGGILILFTFSWIALTIKEGQPCIGRNDWSG
jgi:hypothetical protein